MPKALTVASPNVTGLLLRRTATLLLFVYSAAMLSEGTFNPFIYFQF
jgi:hypothetical protein